MPKIIKPATGAFTLASLSIDSSGRVFSASSGTAGGGNMVPTFQEYGPGTGTYTAGNNANFVGAYILGAGGGGRAPNNRHGGPGGYGYFTAPISPPFSGPYTIGEGGNSGINSGSGGTATNLTNIGTSNGGGGGQQNSIGNVGNAQAGPIGTLTNMQYQSNTGGDYNYSTGPGFNNSTFGMGLFPLPYCKDPSTGNGNPRPIEQGVRFMGMGSTKGNPHGGFNGKGQAGAILVYENSGS